MFDHAGGDERSGGRSSPARNATEETLDPRNRRDVLKGTAAVTSAAGLAGCSTRILGASGTGSGTVVQMTGSSDEAENQGAINEALHAGGLPEDISVEIIATTSESAPQQYTQWLSGGLSQPSLLRTDSGWTVPFILRDQLANLSEELPDVAQRVKENYFETSVATATAPSGDLFAIPMFTDFGLMLYRKDLVEQAGFDPSGWATQPISWQRFAEVTEKTREETNTKYGFTFQGQLGEGLSCCTFNEWMASMGGSYFGDRENILGNVGERPVTVDTQPVIDANRLAQSFLYGPNSKYGLDRIPGPIAPQSAIQWGIAPSLAAFSDGNAVMHRDWPFSVASTGAESAFGKDLGVMPMPYGVKPENAMFEGMGGSKSALGGWHVALNPNAKHYDAALEVLRALSSDEFYLGMLEAIGYVPPKPGLLDSERAQNLDVVGRYTDTLKFAGQHTVPRPVSVAWPMESPRISQQVSSVLRRTSTPTNAMQNLANTLVRIENNVGEARS